MPGETVHIDVTCSNCKTAFVRELVDAVIIIMKLTMTTELCMYTNLNNPSKL